MNHKSTIWSKSGFVLLWMLLFCLCTGPVLAVGTTANTDITNARDPGSDTFPSSVGELAVQFTNSLNSDTSWDRPDTTTTTTVDTGFDMTPNLDANFPTEGNQNLTAGDSVVYTIRVQNKGNNSTAVPFTFNLSTDSGVTGSFHRELFRDSNDNDAFDTGTDERMAVDADSDVFFAEDAYDTFFAVITAKSSASDGDTLGSNLFVTDNAPIGNGTANPGDQWEDGTVIADGSEDANDTQNIFFRTSVAGPVLDVNKNYAAIGGTGEFRPGDTVQFTITVRNDGSDTASNIKVVDAIPQNTTYVDGTAGTNNTLNGNSLTATEFDSTLSNNDDFGDAEASFESNGDAGDGRIRWTIDNVGPSGQPNDRVRVTFRVTID